MKMSDYEQGVVDHGIDLAIGKKQPCATPQYEYQKVAIEQHIRPSAHKIAHRLGNPGSDLDTRRERNGVGHRREI